MKLKKSEVVSLVEYRSLTRQGIQKREHEDRGVRKEYIGGCLMASRGEEGRNKLR